MMHLHHQASWQFLIAVVEDQPRVAVFPELAFDIASSQITGECLP